ncbi:MAG TPA: DUF309 domain-containing protein [Bacillales bacterium]|nr:DUF309 domain-containing protein [Bacillales bacterium]
MPLPYPEAYIEYLVYFHGVRDYFECHEILEEEWKKDPRGKRKNHLRGLIQIAVGLYHWRRGNTVGAERSIRNAANNLKKEKEALQALALDYPALMAQLDEVLENVTRGMSFKDINLPVTDRRLVKQCQQRCEMKGCSMNNPSDLTDWRLMHKHKMPNREQLISKREMKKRGHL